MRIGNDVAENSSRFRRIEEIVYGTGIDQNKLKYRYMKRVRCILWLLVVALGIPEAMAQVTLVKSSGRANEFSLINRKRECTVVCG